MNTSTYPEHYDEINRTLREMPPDLAHEGEEIPHPLIFIGSGDINLWEMGCHGCVMS